MFANLILLLQLLHLSPLYSKLTLACKRLQGGDCLRSAVIQPISVMMQAMASNCTHPIASNCNNDSRVNRPCEMPQHTIGQQFC
jgi:hypothetical protein